MQPLVSVVIPTFNRLPFLKEAVASVLTQQYKNFKLVVVDDASSDATSAWLSEQQDSRLISIIFPENRGVSAARNAGIAKARGEFIAFLDSDDVWQKNKLAEQVRFFGENPSIRVCHTNERWEKNGKFINQKKIHTKQAGFFFERACELCLVSPSTVMLRADVFEEFGNFDENLPVCEDYDLWLRLNAKIPFGFIDKPLITKRGGHSDQLSHKLPAMDRYRVESMMKILKSGEISDEHASILREAISRKIGILKAGAEKHGNKELLEFCERIIYQLEKKWTFGK